MARYYNGAISGYKWGGLMSASLDSGLNAFKEQIDAPVAAFFSSCVRCGLCAESCLFYTETDRSDTHADTQAGTAAPGMEAGIYLLGPAGEVTGIKQSRLPLTKC